MPAPKDFLQLDWNDAIADDCRQLVRLAIREDLDRFYDLTTLALVPETGRGRATIVSRAYGVLAGLKAAVVAVEEMRADVQLQSIRDDGGEIAPGDEIAVLTGSVRDLLVAERLVLNLTSRLSGVASLTRRYVRAIEGTPARIYDTRKTTPGWRRLEKYAVRCGGGRNHRLGLYDAVLIKDNHLAFGLQAESESRFRPADAVRKARQFIQDLLPPERAAATLVEIELDSLEEFPAVLAAEPDIVLLDNMRPDRLREAVAMRDAIQPVVQLEASGGINLETVRAVAETGVERISVGALTHAAIGLDLGLDWTAEPSGP